MAAGAPVAASNFFSRWRASQDEEESSGRESFHEDGSRVLDGADIDASITPAERQQHQDLVMHKAQALESAQPGGEGVDAGFSPDPSSRSRRVSFERGLEKGPAAAHGPAAAPIRKPSSERLDPQNWRWLLQQEELKSLAELSAPSSSAPQTAAEANALRRQAAEELDLSSVKREELHLLSAEELGALDELAYGGDVLQTAFRLEEEANEAAQLEKQTRGDFALATLLQQLEEEEEEANREDERWEHEDREGDEGETEEERQVARAMDMTTEEQEEEDEWKLVERAMARAAEEENAGLNEGLPSPGAGIGAGFGARSEARSGAGVGAGSGVGSGAGSGRDIRRHPTMPPTPPRAEPPPQDDKLAAARALVRQQTQARDM